MGNLWERLDGGENVLTSHMFSAFGQGFNSGTNPDPFGYEAQAGYYTDQETGLVACSFRYYDWTKEGG